MAIGKEYFKVNGLIHAVEGYVGGASNIPLYVPVKFDTNAAGYGAAMIAQIPYVIQCTSPTDDGYFGILYPSEGTEYTWSSSTGFYEAAPGQKIIVARPGSICYAMLDSGAAINTTGATYGGYVSADTNGVDSTAAGQYVAGKIIIEATAYAGANGHFALIEVMDGSITGRFLTADTGTQNIAGDGAITFTKAFNICKLSKAGAGAITIADPVSADFGKVVMVYSSTAQAHVITAGANKINGDMVTATFGGAAKDYVTFMCDGAVWIRTGSLNVTLA